MSQKSFFLVREFALFLVLLFPASAIQAKKAGEEITAGEAKTAGEEKTFGEEKKNDTASIMDALRRADPNYVRSRPLTEAELYGDGWKEEARRIDEAMAAGSDSDDDDEPTLEAPAPESKTAQPIPVLSTSDSPFRVSRNFRLDFKRSSLLPLIRNIPGATISTCRHIADGAVITVKSSKIGAGTDSKDSQDPIWEYDLFQVLRGTPGLVQYFGRYEHEARVWAIFEWSIPLASLLSEKTFFRPSAARILLHKIGTAVQNLHKRGVAHLNIEPENIWIAATEDTKVANWDVRLANLSGAVLLNANGSGKWGKRSSLAFGSPPFRAPELNKPGDTIAKTNLRKADAYSLGIVLRMLLTGTRLSKIPNGDSCATNVIAGLTHPLPEHRWTIGQALAYKNTRSPLTSDNCHRMTKKTAVSPSCP